MSPRDTRSGFVLEQMVLPALKRGGYEFKTQVNVGRRPSGGKHLVDVVASKGGGVPLLISMKWQQTSGTAEQKVPFEVICLLKVMKDNPDTYGKAYIVLGGGGWTLRDFYTKEGLNEYLREATLVKILTLESFVAIANQGRL